MQSRTALIRPGRNLFSNALLGVWRRQDWKPMLTSQSLTGSTMPFTPAYDTIVYCPRAVHDDRLTAVDNSSCIHQAVVAALDARMILVARD